MTVTTQYRHLEHRGPNTYIVGTRNTVQQLFHWHISGMSWEQMLTIATSVTREDLEEVKQYIDENYTELAEQNALITEQLERERAEQLRRFPHLQMLDDMTPEARREWMLAKLKQGRAESNGAHSPGG